MLNNVMERVGLRKIFLVNLIVLKIIWVDGKMF